MAKPKARKKVATKRKLPAVPKTPISEISPDEHIVGAVFLGKVRKYAAKPPSLTVILEAALAVGDGIRVKGADTDLTQKVEHLSVGRQSVQSAVAGETAVVEVADSVKEGDAVYKL